MQDRSSEVYLEPSQATNQIHKKVEKIISFDFKLLKDKHTRNP